MHIFFIDKSNTSRNNKKAHRPHTEDGLHLLIPVVNTTVNNSKPSYFFLFFKIIVTSVDLMAEVFFCTCREKKKSQNILHIAFMHSEIGIITFFNLPRLLYIVNDK